MSELEIDYDYIATTVSFREDALIIPLFKEELDLGLELGGATFEKWAKRLNKQKIIYRGELEEMEYIINTPAMGGISSDPLVYTALNPVAWHKGWLELMEEMEKTSSCLIRLTDSRQCWISSQFKEIFPEVSVQEMLSTKTSDAWTAESLELLKNELKSGQSEFEISYIGYADSFNRQLINMTSHNRLIELDGVWYRLSRNINSELVTAKS